MIIFKNRTVRPMGFAEVFGITVLSVVLLLSVSILYESVDSNLNNWMDKKDDHYRLMWYSSKENLEIINAQSGNGYISLNVKNNGTVVEDISKWSAFANNQYKKFTPQNIYLTPLNNITIYVQLAPFDNTLKLWLPFEEGSGDIAYDLSGNENNLNLYNTTWTAGRYGYGVKYDGNTTTSNTSKVVNTTNEVTYLVWINWSGEFLKPENPDTRYNYTQCIILNGHNNRYLGIVDPNYNGTDYSIDTVLFTLPIDGVVYNLTTEKTIPVDSWVQIAATYDGASMKIYIDGALNATYNIAGNLDPAVNVTWAGSYYNYSYFNGIMDDLKIYDRALTDEEILADYAKTTNNVTLAGQYGNIVVKNGIT